MYIADTLYYGRVAWAGGVMAYNFYSYWGFFSKSYCLTIGAYQRVCALCRKDPENYDEDWVELGENGIETI